MRILSILLLVSVLAGQTPQTWVCDPTLKECRLDPIQGAVEQTVNGIKTVVLPSNQGMQYAFGDGFLLITPILPPGTTEVRIDRAYVMTRTPVVPAGPGVCLTTGSFAADKQYAYWCVPAGDGKTFVWARSPLQTTW